MATNKTLYVLDDDGAFLKDMVDLFAHFATVQTFSHPIRFIQALKDKPPTLSMIDLDLGYRVTRGEDVGATLRKMRQYFIIVSSDLLHNTYKYLDEIGALRVYTKPVKPTMQQPDVFKNYDIFHKSVIRDIKIADQIKSLEKRLNDSYLTHACMTLLQIRRDLSFDEAYELVKAGASNERASMGAFSKAVLESQFNVNQNDVGIALFSLDECIARNEEHVIKNTLLQLRQAQRTLTVAVEEVDIRACFTAVCDIAEKLLPRLASYAGVISPTDFDIKRLLASMDETMQDLFSRVGIFVSILDLERGFEQLQQAGRRATASSDVPQAVKDDLYTIEPVLSDNEYLEDMSNPRYQSQRELLGRLKKN